MMKAVAGNDKLTVPAIFSYGNATKLVTNLKSTYNDKLANSTYLPTKYHRRTKKI